MLYAGCASISYGTHGALRLDFSLFIFIADQVRCEPSYAFASAFSLACLLVFPRPPSLSPPGWAVLLCSPFLQQELFSFLMSSPLIFCSRPITRELKAQTARLCQPAPLLSPSLSLSLFPTSSFSPAARIRPFCYYQPRPLPFFPPPSPPWSSLNIWSFNRIPSVIK